MRIPHTSIELVVISQAEAEERSVRPDEYMISITGTSQYWPEPKFSENAYPLGIFRLKVDDIGDNLPAHQLEELKKTYHQVLRIVEYLRAMNRPVTLVIHCLAGRSRSAAFAVGILGHILKHDHHALVSAINQLNMDFKRANRPFQPNPLFLKHFEKWMGMHEDSLGIICRSISAFFEAWERHWRSHQS